MGQPQVPSCLWVSLPSVPLPKIQADWGVQVQGCGWRFGGVVPARGCDPVAQLPS